MTPLRSNPSGALPLLPDMLAVLVLDDMRFDRHKLNRLCTHLPIKCNVSQADCLSSLNHQLDKHAFDLIFVDYDLPDGSGLDALEMIQLSPRNAKAVSIMVTGIDEASVVTEAMSRGCADYITKDELSPSSFERAVTNALHKSILSTQVTAQSFARQEVETVLNRFANQCISDIKPMVSRMIRQLRNLRDTPDGSTHLLHERRDSVETSCLHLWEFLEQLEGQYAGSTMQELMAKNIPQHANQMATPAATRPPEPRVNGSRGHQLTPTKRPPSPFSRHTQ